jgi:GT2 family glycosyltransferase
MPPIGLVVIGRNEGERLRRCLEAARPHVAPGRAVYVDSGSTDGSVSLARSMNFDVVELDRRILFTAARARNAGVHRLLQIAPDTRYVMFVDGDCEVLPGWWDAAADRLDGRADLAVVCGRRRERFPDASVYNRLCDIEWDTPVGDADSCGGDSMIRIEAFKAVGGFNPGMLAGEEPELCLRLRQKGWRIERIDAEMTLHDANILTLGQWWRREKRTGYAYVQGAVLQGHTPERHRVRRTRSNWLWGLLIPLLAIAPAWPTRGWCLLLLLAYPIQWLRIRAAFRRDRPQNRPNASTYATYVLVGKFPQMLGQLRYRLDRSFRRRGEMIEYKVTTPQRAHDTGSGAANQHLG